MLAVLNYEFLLSVAYCDNQDLLCFVDELSLMSELVSNLSFPPVLEDCSLEKMIHNNLFPSQDLFKKNLSRIEDCPFGAEDVARMVNSILSKAVSLSQIVPSRCCDWVEFFCAPDFDDFEVNRKIEIYSVLENVALVSALDKNNFCLVHFFKNMSPSVRVTGSIEAIIPDELSEYPFPVMVDVPLYRGYSSYLNFFDFSGFFCKSKNIFDFKFLCYAGAKSLIYSGGEEKKLDWSCFSFSSGFWDNLNLHQCLPGQKYGRVLFETVLRILAGRPKYELNEFRCDIHNSAPLISHNFTAYRTHVTKGKLALRLMFWRCDEKIIFANVGNKSELKINPI